MPEIWNHTIQKAEDHPLIAFAGGGSPVRRSRLQRFCGWQIRSADPWYLPDLASWRDHLMESEGLTAVTTRAYLSTVRSAYRQILRSNRVRTWLYDSLPADMSPERKLALITEFHARLKNALDPDNAPVSIVKVQDEADSDHLWLTPAQAAALVQSPGIDTLKGLRDTALIALLLCTGIRAAEAAALDVADLRSKLGGALALRVRSGKGMKQRLIPYGAQDWGLTLTEAWLESAGLTSGPVFVGLRKGDHFYLDVQRKPRRLSERSLENALQAYPISINGDLRTVQPHDLRRTYARRLYLIGTDLAAIQQNMGHDQQDTTLAYIGTLDGEKRAPDDAYGTLWLQPMWDSLAQQKKARRSVQEEVPSDSPSTPLPSSLTEVGGYIFRVWLHNIQPEIWRRFEVPAGISFLTLNTILKLVMGWRGYQTFRFAFDEYTFAPFRLELDDRDAREAIDPYFTQPGTECFYERDRAASWGHVLKLEKIVSAPVNAPRCLSGNRACPPNGSGNPRRYAVFLREHEQPGGHVLPKWQSMIGSYFDPDAFDKDRINQNLQAWWRR